MGEICEKAKVVEEILRRKLRIDGFKGARG